MAGQLRTWPMALEHRPDGVAALRTPIGSLARRVRLAALALLVAGPLLVQVYSFLHFGRCIRLTDEYFYHVHARSWYFDHDCDYANDMLMAPGFENAGRYADMRTPTGLASNYFYCGTSMASVPMLAVADGLTIAHNAIAADDLPRDGYSAYYQLVTALGHTVLGIAGLLATYVVCGRHFAPHLAALAVLCTWLGTSALYYVGYESLHSHADTLAWAGLLLLLTDECVRRGASAGRMALIGLCCGMLVVTRPQELAWAAVPLAAVGPGLLRDLWRPGCGVRTAGVIALSGACAAVCYVPQAIVHDRLFGSALVNSYGRIYLNGVPHLLHWSSPDFLHPLLHASEGLLWASPLMIVAAVGLLAMLRRGRRTVWAGAIGFFVMYYVMACVWWPLGGYGSRGFVSSLPVLSLGLCGVFAWAARERRRAVAVGMITGLMAALQIATLVMVNFGRHSPGGASPLYAWLFA